MIIRVQGLEMMKTTSPIIGEPQRQRAKPEGRTGREGKAEAFRNGLGDPSLPISLRKRHKRKNNLLYDKSLAWRQPWTLRRGILVGEDRVALLLPDAWRFADALYSTSWYMVSITAPQCYGESDWKKIQNAEYPRNIREKIEGVTCTPCHENIKIPAPTPPH